MMEWLKELLERLRAKKTVPVRIPIDKYEMQIDNYLWDLLDKVRTKIT